MSISTRRVLPAVSQAFQHVPKPVRCNLAIACGRAPSRTCRSPGVRHVCRASAIDTEHPVSSEEIVASKRKYVMVSGKGGVGKTSLSASLAVKYASEGHDTLIVSTDPAHSLGDSLGQLLPGGVPVPIEGTDLPIWGMEIDPDMVTEEIKAFASTGGKAKVKVRDSSATFVCTGGCVPDCD